MKQVKRIKRRSLNVVDLRACLVAKQGLRLIRMNNSTNFSVPDTGRPRRSAPPFFLFSLSKIFSACNLLIKLKHILLIFLSLFFVGQSTVYAQCGTIVGDTVYVSSAFNVAGSLRNAINCVNDPSNSIRFIHFSIDDPGVITITPTGAAPLPTITKNNVVIDARTAPGWFPGKVVIDGSVFSSTTHGLNVQANNVEIYGLTITGFTSVSTGSGIFLTGNDAIIEQNILRGNLYGIQTASPFTFTIRNNTIGEDPLSGAADGNSIAGINILTSSMGVFEISNNTIAYNPTGILVASPLVETLISENSMYCNFNEAIERFGFTVSGFAMTEATTNTVSGTAPNGTRIEVFVHDDAGCAAGIIIPCQGRTYLGAATASGGTWELTIPAGMLPFGAEVTATATENGNNTSEFLPCLTASCPDASIIFSDVQAACEGNNTGSATASVSIDGNFDYVWDDPLAQMTATAVNLSPGDYTVRAIDENGCIYSGTISIDVATGPSANPFGTSPICVNETLFLESNVSGGTPPYNYSWTGPDGYTSDEELPNRPNMQIADGGTYTLLVTDDNGCTDTESTFVEVNEAPVFDLNARNISCNGEMDGSIDLIPIAITPPAIYMWSNNETTEDLEDLNPGLYGVTATDGNGCIAIDNQPINEPLPLFIDNITSNSPSSPGGNDGSFSFNINGGTTPYSYSWTGPVDGNDNLLFPGNVIINNLAAGDYSLTITDGNDCEIIRPFTITPFTCDFSIIDSAVINVSCNEGMDGQIDITTLNGVLPITFNWDNGATTEDIFNLSAGDYNLTATDATGCPVFFSATVIAPPTLVVSNTLSTAPSSPGGNDGSFSFDLNGGTAPYSYSWTGPVNGSDNLLPPGNIIINNLPAGDYSLSISDNNGCDLIRPFTIAPFACDFIITASTITDVSCNGEMDGQINITTSNGVAPITFDWDNGETTEDLINLSAGDYNLTATDATGCPVFFSATVNAPPPLFINNIQSNSPSTLGGNDGSFSFDINGGTAPYTYNWTGPVDGSNNLIPPGNVVINNLLAGAYTLVITDANDCTLTRPFTINNIDCNLILEDEIISNESCDGAMDGNINLSVSNGSPPYNYAWDNGTTTDNGTGTTITNLSAATYNISITDQENCVITTTLIVSTNSLPPPGPANSILCDEGNSTALFDLTGLENSISPGPGLDILWFEDQDGNLPILNPAEFLSSGGFVYAATSTVDCTSSLVAIELIVLPLDDPFCMTGECTSFAGTFTNTETLTVCNTFSAVNSYNNDAVLDEDDALLFFLHSQEGEELGTILATSATPEFSFNEANMSYSTTYYLSAVAGNDNGMGGIDFNDPCLSITSGSAIIFSESLGGVLNFIQGEDILCQGEDLFLSTNNLTGFNTNYHWITPNGDTISTADANLLIENIQPLDAGDYYVFVQDESCLFDQTGPFTLNVLGLSPEESIDAGNDTTVCSPQFTLMAAPITNGNGFWTGPSGVNISNPNAALSDVSGLNEGINQFIWSVTTTDCGTIGSDTLIVTLADNLTAEDDFFTLAQANSEIFMDVLKNDGLAEGAEFTLQALSQPEFGSLLTLDNGFQYFEPGGLRGTVSFEYEICYTNGNCANSCATATVTIDVLNLPYLPEGFSPNDDGKNDQLKVLGYINGGSDISMQLQITNRWGDIVYSSDDYLLESPWEGRLNNKQQTLPEGTYYAWMEFTVDGVVYQQSQALYLIK